MELSRLRGGVLRLAGYPLAMVHAEKIITALERGAANTRWRDFVDIYLLSTHHDTDGTRLCTAITAVATHRSVPLDGVLAFADPALTGTAQDRTWIAHHQQWE